MDSLNQLIYYAQSLIYTARQAWQALPGPPALPDHMGGGQAVMYGLAGYGALNILAWAVRHAVQVALGALFVLALFALWQRG